MKKLILLFLLALTITHVNATVYYVKTTGSDAANGITWATAYKTVQKALEVAITNDEIWVASGNYVPTKNIAGATVANARDNTFYLTKNIKLYGGFAGTENNINQRIKDKNITILNGDFTANGIDNDNAYNVIYMDATITGNLSNNCIIDGFSIINGFPSGKPTTGFNLESGGGAIYLKINEAICSAKIENCTFRNNVFNNRGAAIAANTTTGSNNLSLNSCLFPENQDNSILFNFDTYSTDQRDFISSNSTINVINCLFQKNANPINIFNAGAQYGPLNVTFNLTNTTFRGNTIDGTGGPIIIQGFGSTAIINTNFTNCLFDSNSSTDGPGVVLFNASGGATVNSKFINNTFYKNKGVAAAGVINNRNLDNSTMSTAVSNSIFYQNNLDNNGVSMGSEINATEGTATIGVSYSMTQQNSAFSTGTGIINNQNPKFVDAANGDFRLLVGSPAINSGTATGAPSTDITGKPRPQGSGIDMGAYEGAVTRYYVKSTGSDVAIGTTWATAYKTVQKALDVAIASDEIWVASGTYVPTKNIAGTAVTNAADNTFYITKNIKLYGGFAGTETNISQRIAGSNITTLSGDMNADDDYSNNAYHVMVISSTTSNGAILNTCVIDGLTITKGNAFGGALFNLGGGLLVIADGNNETSPQISNCIFQSNRAQIAGAVEVRNYSSLCNLAFNACSFINNSSNTSAGAVEFYYSSGATGSQVINECLFKSNSCLTFGGAIRLECYSTSNKSLTITNSIFDKNTSTNGFGGALSIENYQASLDLKLKNCTLNENSCNAFGGAIYLDNREDIMTSAKGTFNSSIVNCIFWGSKQRGNTDETGSDIDNGSRVDPSANLSVTYSITQQNSTYATGTGIINNQDPKFVNAANGDLRLLSGSPAIDAGTATGAPSTDINGISRPQGSGIDMGAYEGITTLPVKLISLEAAIKNQNQVSLNWQTASETKNDYFTISKSEDGKTFQQLNTVKSKGDNGANYETIDFNPFLGTNYYKLSQTDLDGKTEELGIRTVKIANLKEELLSVYPNPVKDGIINIKNSNLKGFQNLSIYDLSGRKVISEKLNFNGETVTYRINEKLANGTYLLQIGESQKTVKIIIE
ncbi:hypothetical protein A5893_11005 [Pedobacter psychrophilus]|uniref:Secretion system C-terminal sorting domain-containing protein n=1 Tax=Pedobacter psychrophilus TaxID=1826909 RepID=A0A179DDQ0_9SPHI|nr:choice-of-anchor Q domain-containing protein [Pedobacter psychrophilus]OAQ39187.1 hypothetical protein A5893_11005 [Pedobacter psychrophilus]